MPLPITYYDLARLCAAAYVPDRTSTGEWVRAHYVAFHSGFSGGIYRRANGGGFDLVVAITGTDSPLDAVTDAGFGGTLKTAVVAAAPVLGGALVLNAELLLRRQTAQADELLRKAATMQRHDQIVVTGHSLGGGLAIIGGLRFGLSTVAFNPPSVTGARGVGSRIAARSRWGDNPYGKYGQAPAVANVRVRKDPINHTALAGKWYGPTVWIDSARTGGAAHSINETVHELSPCGPFTTLGAADIRATVPAGYCVEMKGAA
jgi:hypothetical protein